MTLVDRSLRRQLTAAMALAMALALLLSGAAFAQTSGNEVAAVPIDDSCNDVPEDGFTDVPETNTFDDEIECLKAYGFTEGTGDGTTYEPSGFTRRWQMVQFVARLAQEADEQLDAFTLPAASDQGFNDIGTLEQRFQDNINIMAEIGVVRGKNATTFDPFSNVKRDQMASFINRLQGAIQDAMGGDPDGFVSSENFFPDVPGDNVHRANINGLASVGIVQGKVDGDYDPHEFVTRGQMSAFIMRHYEVNVDNNVLVSKFPDGVEPGEVTLNESQALAGGTITGSVSDPGGVQTIAVSGCGFTNDPVTVEEDGTFSLTIPAAQVPGACDLVFSVLRTDGTSADTTIPFMVTAAPQQFTDSPDLVSASVTAGDTVTYVFDEAADGATPAATGFLIYNAAGDEAVGTTPEILAGDPTRVVVDFGGAGFDVDDATLATTRDDAVEDAAGNASYASAAALTAQNLVAGRTSAPDLESVSNIRTLGGFVVADFRFDEAVDEVFDTSLGGVWEPTASPFAVVPNDQFFLYTADGSDFPSATIDLVSADRRTLTVSFGVAPATLPMDQVTRGGLFSDQVRDGDANQNPTQTEPRTGDPAFSPGAVADRTDEPDLVSVKVVGDNTVAFEFDEAVNTTFTAANFFVYDSATVETAGTGGSRSSTNANVMNVDFPAGVVGSAVGASVAEVAVTAVGDNEDNLVHELGLQDVSFSAGRTALPDLVSVDISLDAFGDADVVFTFDDDIPATVTTDDFALVDAQGTRFTPGPAAATVIAAGQIDNDDNTVTFDGTGGFNFTNSQAAAAVIGSVQDDSVAGTDMTEGDVAVSRDTSTP